MRRKTARHLSIGLSFPPYTVLSLSAAVNEGEAPSFWKGGMGRLVVEEASYINHFTGQDITVPHSSERVAVALTTQETLHLASETRRYVRSRG